MQRFALGLRVLAKVLAGTSRLEEAAPYTRRDLSLMAPHQFDAGDEDPDSGSAVADYVQILKRLGVSAVEAQRRVESAIEEAFGDLLN